MLKTSDWLLNPHECPGFKKHEVIDHIERSPVIHHTEHLHVHIPKRYALVNINDAENGLLKDISEWIEN